MKSVSFALDAYQEGGQNFCLSTPYPADIKTANSTFILLISQELNIGNSFFIFIIFLKVQMVET